MKARCGMGEDGVACLFWAIFVVLRLVLGFNLLVMPYTANFFF